MKTYGKPKKRSSSKIHSSDDCDICSNRNDTVVKNRDRKLNKVIIEDANNTRTSQ
jgi:hypothetical protein